MNLLFTALTCVLAVAANLQHNDGLTVPTKQGDIVGTRVSSGVRRFLGIPFAVAKRWEPPQLPPPRSEVFSASALGPICPQAITQGNDDFVNLLDPADVNVTMVQSEDCLSMNIWTPSIQRKQKTAVMIWIYGGSFQFGSSSLRIYDGESLVRNNEDVTVVSFNYRLNIFGQPGAPQLYNKTQSQNFGLLDIDAAVQWVYENIASFGGDPERIILFGQSAGAIAIDAYTYAHPHDKRVKGIVQQSGTLSLPGITGANNGTFNPAPWNTVAKAVGCGNVTDNAQLDCLKSVPLKILTNATLNTSALFFPIADGITIFADTRERAIAGNFLRVPLLGGTTKHEADFLVVGEQYGSVGYSMPVVTELLSDILTQTYFACPAAVTFNDRIKANVPTWRYLFSAIFRSITPLPELRAYHQSDVPHVFGTVPNGTQELALSRYMQGAWVAFATDPVSGLAKYGWPQYSPNTTCLVELGGFYNETGTHLLNGERVDFTCRDTDTLWEIWTKLLKAFPEVVLVIS